VDRIGNLITGCGISRAEAPAGDRVMPREAQESRMPPALWSVSRTTVAAMFNVKC